MISVVVFDLGNVLIPWDRRFLFSKLIEDPIELDYFLDNVLTLAVNAKLDSGTSLDELSADLAAEYPQYSDLIEAFRTRWIETLGDPMDESVELLRRLQDRGVRCLALSNWGCDTFEQVQPVYPFLAWFDGRIISGYEGVVKPDPAIFNLLCSRYGVDPPEALFIDDSSNNIAAASELGFETHLFTSPAELESDLMNRALL
ncbi:MAG: HAD family phosphatase [Acidimicrobiales bacterium]